MLCSWALIFPSEIVAKTFSGSLHKRKAIVTKKALGGLPEWVFYCTTVTRMSDWSFWLLDVGTWNGVSCVVTMETPRKKSIWWMKYWVQIWILTGWGIKYLQWQLQSGWSGNTEFVYFKHGLSGSVCCHCAEKSFASQMAGLISSIMEEVLKRFYVFFLCVAQPDGNNISKTITKGQ